MRPKIIQIPRRFVKESWGGTETVILETSKRLIKEGYDVEVRTSLALSDKKKETVYGIQVKRYPYFYTYLGLGKKKKMLLDKRGGNLFSFSLFFSLLFSKNVRAFHLHTMGRLGGIVRTVSKLRGIPYIVTIQGGFLNIPPKELEEMMSPAKELFNYGKPLGFIFGSRRVLRDANVITCLDQLERDLLQKKFPKQKVVFIPSGVSLDKFSSGNKTRFKEKYNISANERILLCVGSFYPQKNELLLVKAFKIVKMSMPDLKLILIGVVYDEKYMEQLRSEISSSGLSGSIIILTGVGFDNQDLVDAYSACDIFVLPSRYETFGIVILEAWAAGKPVVCGRVGGPIYFVKDRENGYFFDVNSAEDISQKITEVLRNKDFAEALAKNGSESVKKYSWEQIVREYIDLYEVISK